MSDYSYIPPIVKEFTFALDIADVVKVVSDFCRQKYWTTTESSGIRYAARSKSVVYRLRSGGGTPASDCQIEVVGRPISKTTRITAQSLECSQDFADHYPASLHRYHACVDSLLAHLADFEITPNLGPTLAQPEPEPVTPADDVTLAEALSQKSKQPTERTRQRAKIFKSIKDEDLSLSYAAVAMRANRPEFEAHRAILGNVGEDDVRNAYRAMEWDWERADKIR